MRVLDRNSQARAADILRMQENGLLEFGNPDATCSLCGSGTVSTFDATGKALAYHLSNICCEKRARAQYAMALRHAAEDQARGYHESAKQRREDAQDIAQRARAKFGANAVRAL